MDKSGYGRYFVPPPDSPALLLETAKEFVMNVFLHLKTAAPERVIIVLRPLPEGRTEHTRNIYALIRICDGKTLAHYRALRSLAGMPHPTGCGLGKLRQRGYVTIK